MTDDEFADKFFQLAIACNFMITSRKNIKCPHGKNLSKDKLKAIHQLLGSQCPRATSNELKNSGIQPCCFTIFRQIAQLIYP